VSKKCQKSVKSVKKVSQKVSKKCHKKCQKSVNKVSKKCQKSGTKSVIVHKCCDQIYMRSISLTVLSLCRYTQMPSSTYVHSGIVFVWKLRGHEIESGSCLIKKYLQITTTFFISESLQTSLFHTYVLTYIPSWKSMLDS
jgi:hypothetical protein